MEKQRTELASLHPAQKKTACIVSAVNRIITFTKRIHSSNMNDWTQGIIYFRWETEKAHDKFKKKE
jgi:hypothetical protein